VALGDLVRTSHVQPSIFWTPTSFLATGLFLAPIISGRELRWQAWLAYGLLGALAVVAFGSLIGEGLDIHGWLTPALHAFGMQGWEYLDLGRVWQFLLTAGLLFWAFMLFRGLRGALKGTSRVNLPWLLFYTGLAIPAFSTVRLLTSFESNYTVADFWRFMVVHLWVEDFLEISTTVKMACTSSSHDRELTLATQPWPHSEATRFHRGLVLVLITLAALLVTATAVRHHQPEGLAVLVVPLAICMVLAQRFTEHFRRTPTGFPDATAAIELRVTPQSRSRWAADHREAK